MYKHYTCWGKISFYTTLVYMRCLDEFTLSWRCMSFIFCQEVFFTNSYLIFLEFLSRNATCGSPLLFTNAGALLENVEVNASSSLSGREPQQAWLDGSSCWTASATTDDQFYQVFMNIFFWCLNAQLFQMCCFEKCVTFKGVYMSL